MCGIVGIFGFETEEPVTEATLIRMRDTMVHRGPDGGGVWLTSDGRVGLAHRRLSIIDLSEAANQPLANENGSVRIVFNGEIYNHAELRPELERSGHRFRTDHSDTEVIVHAYEEWGYECLERFRGVFALAIWDQHRQRLWLVRDRIGVKPLYYTIHDGRLLFASEIKALLAYGGLKREVDEEAFYHYLSFLTTPAPKTLFKDIFKLPPGHELLIGKSGHPEVSRWWDVWDHTEPLIGVSDAEIAERVLEELRVAVRYRKVSDVPVGVFLSGGIDSSTNAALFSEGDDNRVKTFTIGYKGQYQTYRNETDYARMMARRVNAEYHERLLTVRDLIDFLPQMVHLQDEPIADPVCVPVYYVSKLARDHGVTVCQVGEGADELFWGYLGWKWSLKLQNLNSLPVPRPLKRLGLAGLRLIGKEQSFYYEWLRRGMEGLPIFWGGAEAFTEARKQRLLSPRLRREFSDLSSWEALQPIRQRFEERAWEPSPLNWMTYLDLNFRLPELLLMRVDKMSMGTSLEGRVPFLDHKFVELALSIPQSVKTRDNVQKYVLKKAVRGLIPDELIDRKKQGFGVPVYEWFFTELGDRARRELDEFCAETDFLDHAEVVRLFDQRRYGAQLWYLLNFALWWKEYIR